MANLIAGLIEVLEQEHRLGVARNPSQRPAIRIPAADVAATRAEGDRRSGGRYSGGLTVWPGRPAIWRRTPAARIRDLDYSILAPVHRISFANFSYSLLRKDAACSGVLPTMSTPEVCSLARI